MSFILLILAGVVPSVLAKILRPADQIGRLLTLGIAGSMLVAGMEYAERAPISLLGSLVGAVVMLVLYAVIPHGADTIEENQDDDVRKAA